MKKGQLIKLYGVIRDLKSGDLGESLYPYAKLRLKLKALFEEFEEARREFSEQTKTDDPIQHQKAFEPLMNRWLDEEIEINTKVFSFENAVNFCNHNDVVGSIQDKILNTMTK
jgi:hypothetical protein